MEAILLVTDDPGRSQGLAQDLARGSPCEIHDLYAAAAPVGPASTLLADIKDMNSDAIDRLRRVMGKVRRGTPLFVLLHRDTRRTHLMAVALGATRTVTVPYDMTQLREMVGASHVAPQPMPSGADSSPPSACAVRTAAEARDFFVTTFVPDRPICPSVVDTGTNLIKRAMREVGIRNWIRAVRQFDDATHQHCLLVAGLAAAFATSLGLGEVERHRLTKAALLHDVGKIHVPAIILNKPGKLTDAEMAVVRLHPGTGYSMLADQGFEPEMLAVVRSHHEMLDGSGYPDGRKGTDIPDLVRLVTVCDVYAALVERRCYKAPMASEAACATLESMVGRLDPAIVGAFKPFAAPLADA